MTLYQALWACVHSPDELVLIIRYKSLDANTVRIVSPISIDVHAGVFEAFCLCREDFRKFRLQNVIKFRLVAANTVLAPVPIVTEPRPV